MIAVVNGATFNVLTSSLADLVAPGLDITAGWVTSDTATYGP